MNKILLKFLLIPFVFSALIFVTSCSQNLTCPACPSCPQSATVFYKEFARGIYPFAGYNNATDNTIDQANPGTNNGLSTDMEIYSSGTAAKRILIMYLIKGEIPGNAVIKKASLTLSAYGIPGNLTMTAYEVPQDFLEAYSSWNNSGLGSWTGGGVYNPTALGSIFINGQETVTIDINAAFVKDCLMMSTKEFRILLKSKEDLSGESATFCSSDFVDPQYRPKLTVYYTVN